MISPVYDAEKIVPTLVDRIFNELSKLTNEFEIILVDDGSRDSSWRIIEELCAKYNWLKGIKLSRNFGQHHAVSAGINSAKGNYIILMDCDLQDNPDNIEALIKKLDSGFEIVFTKRKKRKQPILKSFFSKLFDLLFTFLSDKKFDINVGSLVAFRKRVGVEFSKLKEQDRIYIQMLKWLGFKSTSIIVEHEKRHSGASSYSFRSLFSMAIQSLTAHSDKMLRISIYIGFLLGFMSLCGVALIFVLYFAKGLQPGWPSLFVAILFSTGLILISLGVTGIYIGKTFQQVKNRPLYIVDKKVNFAIDD